MKHIYTLLGFLCFSLAYSINSIAAGSALIDSTITTDQNGNLKYKTEYVYDAAGRQVGTTTYRWVNGVMTGDSKTFTIYDGSNRHVADVNYLWDSDNNRWIGKDSTVTTYLSSSGTTFTDKIIYQWGSNNDWIGQTAYHYTYFNNNASKKTLELEQHWDTNTNDWIGFKKTERQYDSSGNNTLEIVYASYNTTTSTWVGSTKKVYGYTSGKQTLSESYTWDANHNGGAWKGNTNGKTTWTFNSSGYQTNKTVFAWNNNTWNWQNSTKNETSYDGTSNRKTDDANYTWNGSAWIGSGTRTSITYDNARETNKTVYTWSNGAWTKSTKTETSYDGTSTRKTDIANYTWNGTAWVGTGTRTTYEYDSAREITKTTYTWSNGAWVNATKLETSYDGTSTRKTDIANYTWNGSGWVGQGTRTVTTYYSTGLAENVTSYTWQNNQWTATTNVYKKYNTSKVVILTLTTNWNGSSWINSTKDTVAYSGSTKTSEDSYSWDSTLSDWKHTSQTEYFSWGKITSKLTNNVWARYSGDSTYNGIVDGVTINAKFTWDRNNSKWIGSTKTETKTLEHGDEKITYQWSNNQWTYKTLVTNEYDSRFPTKKIAEGSFTWTNNQWQTSYRYVYEYDDAQHTILEEQYKWNSTTQSEYGFSKTEREYTDDYVLTKSYTWSNGSWIGTTGTKVTNDAQGRTIENLTLSYYNSQWNNDRKNEYVYDSNGNTTVSNTYIWMISVWAYLSRSEKTYDDDSDNKLRTQLTATYNNGSLTDYNYVTYFYTTDCHNTYSTDEPVTICSNQLPYTWRNKSLANEGTYKDTIPNAAGCDSIISFTLSVNQVTYGAENATIRETQLPYHWNGMDCATQGEHVYTTANAAGCDSIVTLTLNILPTTYGTDAATICSNQLPYIWHNKSLTGAAVFNDTIDNIAGGDSVITCTLTVNQVTYGAESATVRETQLPYHWNGMDCSTQGEHTYTTTNTAGCDSIVTLTLNILLTTYGTDAKTICSSELPYIWHNKSLTGAAVFNDTIDNIAGGDSVITCTFSVNQVTYGAENATVRETRLPYHWNGMECATQGEHTYTTTNAAGCDSIVTLTLNILPTTYGTDAKTICSSELPYIWHNKTLTGEAVFNDTIDNIAGGDSVITCTLTVNQVTYGAESATVRETQLPYHWNGMDCSTQGEHVYTTTNAAGCDSIVTLTLNILPTTYGTDAATIYSDQLPYLWHNKTLTGATIFNDTIDNIAGGDSIIVCTLSVIQLTKVDEYVPPITVCQGETFVSRSGKEHVINFVSLWNDTIRHHKSSAEIIDSIYHYVASPYVVSAPELDATGLAPKCNQYLDIANLTSSVLEYIYSTDGSAPLIEPVTQAVEWQMHYEDEDWREWLNLPLADNKSTISLRVIIHTICGDATSAGIDLPIECSATALQDAVVSFDPTQPAYTPLGQLISDLDSYTGIVIQNGHKFFK